MIRSLHRRLRRGADAGFAMLATVLVVVLVAAVGATVIGIASKNLEDSGLDRLEAQSLGTTEAGIAGAIQYLRSGGMAQVNSCYTTSCTTLDWMNSASPHQVTPPGAPTGQYFKVWISVNHLFSPPTVMDSQYVIHSKGYAGPGPGEHEISQVVTMQPFDFPVGVYAGSINSAGNAGVHHESIFTSGCVSGRSHVTFDPADGVDPYYGIYAGVHSTGVVTTRMHCPGSSIHASAACNPTYPHDQDSGGGPIPAAQSGVGAGLCAIKQGATAGSETSKFTTNDLQNSYHTQGLTPDQFSALKTMAESENQYYGPSDTPFSNSLTDASGNPLYDNVVIYIDGQDVQLGDQLNLYGKATCGTRSVVLVIRNGSLHVNAGADLTGSIFVPEGTYFGNGHASVEGTLYAQTIDKFNGTADFYLDSCWVQNMPGGLFSVTVNDFNEQYGGPSNP